MMAPNIDLSREYNYDDGRFQRVAQARDTRLSSSPARQHSHRLLAVRMEQAERLCVRVSR